MASHLLVIFKQTGFSELIAIHPLGEMGTTEGTEQLHLPVTKLPEIVKPL